MRKNRLCNGLYDKEIGKGDVTMNQDNIVYVRKYNGNDTAIFPVNKQEVWRYSGYTGIAKNVDENINKLFDDIMKELENCFQFKVCYRRMPLKWDGDMPVFPFPCESKDLARCLKGCSEVVVFAATIGLEIDRKIARYERFSPAKALLIHCYGAERIESLCDGFCNEIEQELLSEQLYCTNRFSPGYGDLPLELQRDLFTLLDCNRKIGVSLNESLLMSPSKSVTAIFGIGSCVRQRKKGYNCSACKKTDCEFRETD